MLGELAGCPPPRLHIAERTAENHVRNILDKLGFDSRTRIAAWYARRTVNR